MPKLKWAGFEDVEIAAAQVGPRIRTLREARKLSIRGLSERAGVSKTTLLRLEQGLPIAEKIFHRICDCLQTLPLNLLVSDEPTVTPYRLQRGGEAPWRIAFRREKAPAHFKDFEVMEGDAERNRVGNLGFVTGFFQAQDCTLSGGRLQSAVVELYGLQEKAGYRHSGEEFVYCLQGRLRLTISEETLILEPGDSVCFWSGHRHRYESDLPVSAGTPPTLMLMVWIEGKEEKEAISHDAECD